MTAEDPTGPVLVTGGAGFFGSLLVRHLLDVGETCVALDLYPTETRHPRLTTVRGDIRDQPLLDGLFDTHRFKTVYHCAAMLAHAVKDRRVLWESNVTGTRNLAEAAARVGTRSFVFTSSNCLWAHNMHRPVREDDAPAPVEIYGRSKWEGEKILAEYADRFNAISIRCPTIIDEGRLGLLAILFEFIDEGRKIWMIGGGHNRYQFIYAPDLVNACVLAANHPRSAVLNIGSDDVPTLREAFDSVIRRANTGSRIVAFPKAPALMALRLAHLLKISPLGPYQYSMIAEDFIFDTSRIKRALGWRPTLNNSEMLWRAYEYYHRNRSSIAERGNVSAHRQPAKMGALRLVKWVS